MERKRDIQLGLTLDKAREYYREGGELQKIALMAFPEEELEEAPEPKEYMDSLPKSWDEFCENGKGGRFFIREDAEIIRVDPYGRLQERSRALLPSFEAARAHRAAIPLRRLRDAYRQGWEPDWCDEGQWKYCIVREMGVLTVDTEFSQQRFLAFQTKKTAAMFLKHFRELIVLADDLV